jgi:hypothetical protein
MDDINIINTVNDFYRLKSEYEKTLYNEKINIINSSLSKEDKLKRYKLFTPKCINCKQGVGTIFSTTNNKLIAKCGATKSIFQKNFTPCGLHMHIERGNVELLSNIIDEFSQAKETDKDDIIKTKLNYFFNFENEDTTVENFKELKKSYTENMDTYLDYIDEFTNKVNNNDNKQEIEKTKLDIHESKEKIKAIIKLYKEEQGNQQMMGSNEGYITEAVDEYKDVLQNLINKYNTLMYSYYTIESHRKKETDEQKKDNDDQQKIYNLCKKQYTIKDIEISIDASYKIISNKK